MLDGARKKRNKKLLFVAFGDEKWIGGLYYIKNILYSVLLNNKITSAFDIFLLTYDDNKTIFSEFEGKITIETCEREKVVEIQLNRILRRLVCRSFNFYIWKMVIKHHIDYIYCCTSGGPYIGCKKQSIMWIPDFQHLHYPQYFSKKILMARERTNKKMLKMHGKLVLSSQDAYDDCVTHYKRINANIFIVPFVSAIESELKDLSDELSVLEHYGLNKKKYICVPNQFWIHKNHLVVLKAIDKMYANDVIDKNVIFVFTGKYTPNLEIDYYKQLNEYFEKQIIKEHTIQLGFIPRHDQLIVLKNAEFLIQPSLFEGWGTVLEDAKVLNQRVLLSDIPVHREQKNENCIMFSAKDEDDLLEKIILLLKPKKTVDCQRGIKQMRKDAYLYSERFYSLLQ